MTDLPDEERDSEPNQGITYIPMEVMTDKTIPAYDKLVYAAIRVRSGEPAVGIAEEFGLDVNDLRASMQRWLERGTIWTERGTWGFQWDKKPSER